MGDKPILTGEIKPPPERQPNETVIVHGADPSKLVTLAPKTKSR